ncbi:Coenzyme F420 hydrogenase/dehydrogenase, beta subunit C-terminal domain [Fundicoccus ignavus]|uniref:Coenzyme F420 hydrogenase n=1 Tax=Fundicoccus ignavus TaxID=2664442 RepID=A0A844C1B4_9LACT|nr:Coenzyme F420 hydrogenase/dehydrogenase, beta subunit C-terminal domain [Fundicoccus ignavus]MRJ46922.1 coenzyme F420 hydrogenase [Fundicoccus ignavus]
MNTTEFEMKKVYSEASGAMSVVDSNIRMRMNEYGLFEESLIDDNSEISQTAVFVSPNLNKETNESEVAEKLYAGDSGISFDERIGYYHSTYVGHVLEGDYRNNASSGGMATWVFKELFDNNLIDYVIHVKKNSDSNSNQMFKYDISSSIKEIKEGAKTRYYPVEISEVMDKVKEQPGRYAIIGIPSFIYSVRLLAMTDPIFKERIKYTIGLVCGHQKSTKFSESMAFQVGIKPGDLKDIDFRHKLLDRPASSYAVKMTGLIDGEMKTVVKPKSELYGQNWGWGFFKPTASDFTDDVFNETADLVVGDAWLPEYTTDSQGNNIVIVRNKEIDNLIKKAMKSQLIKMDVVDKEIIFKSQASHYRHTHDELAYRLHVKDKEKEWRPSKRVSANPNLSKTRQEIQDLRKIISDQSHILYQEAVIRNDFNYFVKQMTQHTSRYTALYKTINRRDRFKRFLKMKPHEIFSKLMKRLKK